MAAHGRESESKPLFSTGLRSEIDRETETKPTKCSSGGEGGENDARLRSSDGFQLLLCSHDVGVSGIDDAEAGHTEVATASTPEVDVVFVSFCFVLFCFAERRKKGRSIGS